MKYKDNYTVDFSWQLGAGLGVEVTENIIVDLSYRYVDLGEVEISRLYQTEDSGFVSSSVLASTPKSDLTAHEVLIGLRYDF